MFATIARALASGSREAFSLICGIVVGDIIFLLFAVFGLSIVAQAMGDLFFIVKICGCIYLIFLGIKIWRKEPDSINSKHKQSKKTRWGNFISGLLITLSNPKVILFYCGFLPTFLNLSTLSLIDLFVVVIIVATGVTCVLGTYAFLASKTRQMFTNQKTAKRFNQAAGGVMVATGVALATQ
ncbi:MAG: LysE family translocator [Desulfobacteraceae bacterium]|nr:LysE family translocator [Desulfobacteraceae bacterium]